MFQTTNLDLYFSRTTCSPCEEVLSRIIRFFVPTQLQGFDGLCSYYRGTTRPRSVLELSVWRPAFYKFQTCPLRLDFIDFPWFLCLAWQILTRSNFQYVHFSAKYITRSTTIDQPNPIINLGNKKNQKEEANKNCFMCLFCNIYNIKYR